jgi:hypothetical protein
MARTSIYEYAVNTAGTAAIFAFTNGDTIRIDLGTLPEDIKTAALWHGIKQKVADGAAIARDTETGRSATLEDKIAAMRVIADRLPVSWNAVSDGNGGNAGGWLLKALMVKYPTKSRDTLVEFLAGKSDKQKAALRADASIAPIIQSLKDAAGKAASAGIDTDELLGELED